MIGRAYKADSKPDSDVDLALEVVNLEGETAVTRYYCNRDVWKDELNLTLGRPISMIRLSDNSKPDIQESIEREGVLLYKSPP